MDNNISDVKIFLKVKNVEYTEDRPYYKINENKQIITLLDMKRKIYTEKSTTVKCEKIFTDEENSYIYEIVCRDALSDALSGYNICFFAYGVSQTGKKSTIFGSHNSCENINKKGLCYRMIEYLIENNIQFTISFFSVYGNQYIDLSYLYGKENDEYEYNKLINHYKDVKSTTDFNKCIKKLSVNPSIIKFFLKILDIYFKLGLSSRSHFMITINLKNNSKITFGTLAGSEKLMNIDETDLSKARDSIYIQNAFCNLVKLIGSLKSKDFKNDKISELGFDESALTYCLKDYLINARFRIIGCIFPNTGYYENVRDTLMFLERCLKTVAPAITESSTKESKQDEIIYNLNNENNSLKKNIVKLEHKIAELEKKIEKSAIDYKKNIDIIKTAFNFEGDVNKLLLNDEYISEAKYAKKIRTSMDMVKYLNKRVSELEKKLEDLNSDNRKLDLEKKIIESDKTMFNVYTKMKEDYLHEENKLRINTDHAKELDILRNEIERLRTKNEALINMIEDKNKHIHNLPNLLKDNIAERKENGKKIEEMKKSYDFTVKSTIKDLNNNFNKNTLLSKQIHEAIVLQKDHDLEDLRRAFNETKRNYEDDLNKLNNELLSLYDISMKYMNNNKKNLDVKKINSNLLNNPNFVNLKSELDKEYKILYSFITRANFPYLHKILELKKLKVSINKEIPINIEIFESFESSESIKFKNSTKIQANTKCNDILELSFSDLNEEFNKLRPKSIYNNEDLSKYEKSELIKIVLELQLNIQSFQDYIKTNIKIFKKNKSNIPISDEEEYNRLYNQVEKLRIQLDEQIKINNNNKIIIESKNRIIEKSATQNFFRNNGLNLKQTSYPSNENYSPGYIRPVSGLSVSTRGTSPYVRPTTSTTELIKGGSSPKRPTSTRPLTSIDKK